MEVFPPPPPPPQPPSSSQPICDSVSTTESIATPLEPTIDIPASNSSPNQRTENGGKVSKNKKKAKTRVSRASSSASSSTSSYIQQQQQQQQQQRGLRVVGVKSKIPKVLMNGGGGGGNSRSRLYSESDFDSLALPLGMSIAAVVAQVLDRNNAEDERLSTNHLSVICSSAVKESLANVFGDRFDRFVKNFGESFGCTLKTLRVVNDASLSERESSANSSIESSKCDASPSYTDEQGHNQSSSPLKSLADQSLSFDGHGNDPSSSKISVRVSSPTFSDICKSLGPFGEKQENVRLDEMNRELTLHGERNQQLACVAPGKQSFGSNGFMLSTFEKSVVEQTRSNDLKMLEITLKMKELKLKESELALSSDSNLLDRFKLSMGISKASFRAEKFQNQLEETRHAELLKKCIDCLVAGLFIMCASLVYGAYVYSYKRISEVTTSCTASPEASKSSWFLPKSVTSFSTGWNTLKCQSIVITRMFFGMFMILTVGYLLLQRSSTKQTMPVTHILLLLGLLCGIAGKLCVDTLGGNGYFWLIYWEALCMLHFFINIFTSMFFIFLHGSLLKSQGIGTKVRVPFWVRRFVFYSLSLVFLPLLCGLMPFAGPGEWMDHFVSLAADTLFVDVSV